MSLFVKIRLCQVRWCSPTAHLKLGPNSGKWLKWRHKHRVEQNNTLGGDLWAEIPWVHKYRKRERRPVPTSRRAVFKAKIYSLVHGFVEKSYSSNVPTNSRQENCAREHEREMAEKPSGLRKSVALNNFLSVCKAKNTCKLIQPTRKEITLHCQI